MIDGGSMGKIEFSEIGDPDKIESLGLYMIDGVKVTHKEFIKKGLDLSIITGKAMVHTYWDEQGNKIAQDLITNPYKDS